MREDAQREQEFGESLAIISDIHRNVCRDPSLMAPRGRKRLALSVGPLYEREAGRVTRAGVLAIAGRVGVVRGTNTVAEA